MVLRGLAILGTLVVAAVIAYAVSGEPDDGPSGGAAATGLASADECPIPRTHACQMHRRAFRFNAMRREGLSKIARSIEAHGDSPRDEAQLRDIQAELARLRDEARALAS